MIEAIFAATVFLAVVFSIWVAVRFSKRQSQEANLNLNQMLSEVYESGRAGKVYSLNFKGLVYPYSNGGLTAKELDALRKSYLKGVYSRAEEIGIVGSKSSVKSYPFAKAGDAEAIKSFEDGYAQGHDSFIKRISRV